MAGAPQGPRRTKSLNGALEHVTHFLPFSPFLLGFDEIERALERVSKGVDGYPPYQYRADRRRRRRTGTPAHHARSRGLTRDQLDVSIEEKQLLIRGRQQEDKARQYLHRGIAARQFQRTFLLADGMEVLGADLKNGLLSIDLVRPEPARTVKTIAISQQDKPESQGSHPSLI